jgi:multidrug efflux system outer membrane protein
VRIAVARVDQARAIFDTVKRDQYPTVTAGAVADRRSEAIPSFSNTPLTVSSYSIGFDAFWEVDVFGRIRNQVRSATATAEGYQANLDDVRVSVAAEVARNYFELRGLQQRLAVAERSLANQQETLRLTQVRRDAGIGEEQDASAAAHPLVQNDQVLGRLGERMRHQEQATLVQLGSVGDADRDHAIARC